ncbi:glycoside hydrolase family 2 TIM barrel-domain containing protein [Actinopolyspora mortivallis]|uniref:glycoside hydrolase family 2 TIM barrel-domain containing protein n=1 Tax=Actinopolyspora mortivallis TaxID=33906 RepID=UPI000366908F|nr:glycoside hydrolase family 2 TIM barrel-domain containing protein [Actinopolyspora mortivallis]
MGRARRLRPSGRLATAAVLTVVLPLLPATAQAQRPPDGPTDPVTTESYLENPGMVGENQQPHHVYLRPYDNAEQALRAARQDTAAERDRPTRWTRSLDGQWRFRYVEHHRELDGRWQTGRSTREWDRISVPGVWQQQGYGHPVYRNVPSEIAPYDPPNVPDDVNPTGAYVREFRVPDDWDGRRQLLRFEGSTSGTFVWVNGEYVGYDQGGYTPAEYDVTEHLRPGQRNTVAVRVHRWGSGSYLENMDFWHLSGIFRDVRMYSLPRTHMSDVTVRTDLDDSHTDATLDLGVELSRVAGGTSGPHRVRAKLYDPDGSRIAEFTGDTEVHGNSARLELSRRVESPRLWSDETPALHTVVLELLGPDGTVLQTTQQPVGFREVTTENERILLNGEPVHLRGVNRHEHDPETGRALDRRRQRQDVELIRRNNINAVRTSHYPNDPYWYRLADRKGLLLADEVDIETHYREDCSAEPERDCLADRPEWQAAFADRFAAMVQRDKNHPSVIIWDTGNEAGLGQAHYDMADYARNTDPTRLLYHQANNHGGDAPYADVAGPRYPSPGALEEIARTTTKPVVMGEWLHAMGNSLGHYEDMWRTIRNHPSLRGGFVWDWVDQGLSRPLRVLPDSSGNDIPVHVNGNPSLVDGVSGRGLELSGLDDWAQAYRAPELDVTGREVTLDIRVKPLSWKGSNTFLAKGDRQWALQMPDRDHVEFFVYGEGEWHTARVRIPEDWWGNWHRVTGTYDGSEVRLFLDGEQVASEPYDGTIAQNTMYTVTIGRNQEKHRDNFAGRTAHAVVDNARIYDRALPVGQLVAGRDPTERAVLALNFDRQRERGSYRTYGASPFVANGLVNADREPQPELKQLAHSHAPVRFDTVEGAPDAADGRFVVRNLNHTLSTSVYDLTWQLRENGRTVAEGPIDVTVPPGQSRRVELDLPPAERTERFLVLRAELREAARGIPTGHPVASEQLAAGGSRPPAAPGTTALAETDGQLSVESTRREIHVRGADFDYTFDRAEGTLSSLSPDGARRLVSGPELDVFRAPIGNEWSDWSGVNAEAKFRAVGLDRLESEVRSVRVDRDEAGRARVVVHTRSSAPDVSGNGFDSRWTYRIDAGGRVELEHRVRAYGERMRSLPWLPRVGMSLRVPDSFGQLSWYGRGPGESYPDRRSAQHVGRWSGSVDEQWFDFLPPQDNGVKVDTEWVHLSGERAGISVAGDGLAVSADRYSTAHRTDFAHQLRKDPFVTLHVSADVTGLGDTPNPVRDRYRVRPDRTHIYSVVLRPTAH